MVEHLYAHIPFCPKVCPYCSFYKEASDRNKTQAFLDAMLIEAELHAPLLRPRTVFFGGGTPTALSTPQLEFLITGLQKRIDWSAVEEFTLEMNPATVSLEKAKHLKGLGVNRVSMGVQSWDPGMLLTLGRVHSADQARRSYDILREAGFENVNLDFIFGAPGHTREIWRSTLEQTVAMKPNHISAYCLTYEEDTEYFARFSRGEYKTDNELDADLFEMTMDILGGAGFAQYEISNYCQPGRESQHNLAYWMGSDYLGLGPSAFSTHGSLRWKNVSDTSAYILGMNAGGEARDFSEKIDLEIRQSEHIAFALRTNRGVAESLVSPVKTAELSNKGYMARENGHWRLTRQGRMVADEIAEMLMEPAA